MSDTKPPPYSPIQPIAISSRWFPPGRDFGLYESGGALAPNVTSVLATEFPFDRSKWEEAEPGIDHDQVAREAAERGAAYPEAYTDWLDLLARWHAANGHEVQAEQDAYASGRTQPT